MKHTHVQLTLLHDKRQAYLQEVLLRDVLWQVSLEGLISNLFAIFTLVSDVGLRIFASTH